MDTAEKISAVKDWQKMNPLKIWRTSQIPYIGIHTAAALIGVTPSTIQTWEGGMYAPRLPHLLKLAEVLGDSNIAATWQAWEELRPEVARK